MKKALVLFVTLAMVFIGSRAHAAAYPSVLEGTGPVNGYVLQTNGSASTWVATSSLGISVTHAASSTLLSDSNTFSGTNTFLNLITGSVSGNSGTATKLATPRAINGVNFDGSAPITVNAASSTLLADHNVFSQVNTFLGLLTTSLSSNSFLNISSGGDGEALSLRGANATSDGTDGGYILLQSGNASTTGQGGDMRLYSGNGSANASNGNGNGGNFYGWGGNGGGAGGNGGNAEVRAGSAFAGGGNGGNVSLVAGLKNGAGTNGSINVNTDGTAGSAQLSTSLLSTDRKFNFPDVAGTLCVQGSCSAASSTLLADANTFTGINSFTNASSNWGGTWQTYSPVHFQYAFSTSTLSASSPLTGSFIQVGSGGTLGIQAASASQNGYLSLADYSLLHTATTTFSSPLVYTQATNAVTCPTCSSGSPFPFTPSANYNSTSTVLGLNGFFTTASSTFVVAPTFSSLTGLLQGNGTSAITAVTGTVGQFPYYNGTNTLFATSSLLISTANNIGISTTTPWARLSVDTSSLAAGAPEFSVGSSTRQDFLITQAGKVGIASSSPFYPLSITGDIGLTTIGNKIIGPVINADQAYLKFDDAGTGARLNFHSQFTDFNSSSATRFLGASLEINNGAYLQSQKDFTNFANIASAGSQLKSSGRNILDARYWNTSTVTSRDATFSQQYFMSANTSNQPTGRVGFTFGDTENYSNIEAMTLQNTGNVGVGTTTPWAKLSVHAMPGDTKLMLFAIASSTANSTSTLFSISNTGHVIASSTSPALSSCGTSPSMRGDDSHGEVTVGATGTGCTITYANPYSVAPSCVVTPQTGSIVNVFSYTVSATALTVTQTGLGGNVFNYLCEGFTGQ